MEEVHHWMVASPEAVAMVVVHPEELDHLDDLTDQDDRLVLCYYSDFHPEEEVVVNMDEIHHLVVVQVAHLDHLEDRIDHPVIHHLICLTSQMETASTNPNHLADLPHFSLRSY